MKVWLEDDDPYPDDMEDIWGEALALYKMQDLRKWINC
jgi:hypothetical protein